MPVTDRSAQGTSNRRQGHQHERNVVAHLIPNGYPLARRQLHGQSGDIENTGDVSMECKYTGWQAIPAAVDQAQKDAVRRGLARGVVIKKRQGIADVGEGFWIGRVADELAANVRLEHLEKENSQLRAELARLGHNGATVVASGGAGSGGAGGGGAAGISVVVTSGTNGTSGHGGGGASWQSRTRPESRQDRRVRLAREAASRPVRTVTPVFKEPRPAHPEGLPF